ncbi:hypothetical protein [Sulfurisoma sediminicola]|uniref:Uncharacterized protein n=1 Tax=Sulfurisoma sediminicola TaxID=1381557 RepID=A0A497XAP1_9PROT|nr:hypothetical protein [Sulfurisoma sediminicola]RLJ63627.1 hypothetical protein DFR35_2257 [Sulfurisoma sediminicola]
MSDNVIDKADSLMRRHRPVPAGDAAATAAKSADVDDLPVLTEVVASADEPALSPSIRDIEELLRERLVAALPQQRELLRRELASWLDEQLPQLVMRILDGITDQLVAQINTQARMTLLPKLQAVLEAENEKPAD